MEYNKRDIKIGCINVRGFNSSVPLMRKLLDEVDKLAVSEHLLHQNKLNRLSEVSENVHFCARSSNFASSENYGTRGQGGVALFWNKDLSGIAALNDIDNDRICGVRIQTKSRSVINIFSIYLPAVGSPEDFDATLDELGDIIESREVGSLSIVCGDANADPGHMGGPRSNSEPNEQGRSLMKFVNEYHLDAVNLSTVATGPVCTHFGPLGCATLDYILIPKSLKEEVKTCVVGPESNLNCSDHIPVRVTLNIEMEACKYVESGRPKVIRWDKWTQEERLIRYTNPVCLELTSIYTAFENCSKNATNLDQFIESIIRILHEKVKEVPTSKFKPHIKPYWNQDLTRLKKVKVEKYKAWKIAGRPKGEDPFYISHREANKNFSREMRRLPKLYEQQQLNDVVNSIGLNKSFFWRAIKKSRTTPVHKALAIRNPRKTVVHKLDDVLEAWREYFATLCTPRDDEDFDKGHFEHVVDVSPIIIMRMI